MGTRKSSVSGFNASHKSMMLLYLTIWVLFWSLACCPNTGICVESEEDLAAPQYRRQIESDQTDDIASLKRSTEERLKQIENTLSTIRITGEKSEERSYFNKMIGIELVRNVRIMVVILGVIAIVFPFTIWLMSRKRLLGLSGLSSEVTATLLVVEERQAKLANILKEIQSEIDYMHTMSAPDLKKLIEQAEKYLKQNQEDLKSTGSRNTGEKTD